MTSVEIHGLDDFEGGGAIPMILGVDSASLPQAYLRAGWGVPSNESDEESLAQKNPFHTYNSLTPLDQLKLRVWEPWLKGDEPFMKQDPDPLFFGNTSDHVQALHTEWLKKNKALRDGYAQYKTWLADEKARVKNTK